MILAILLTLGYAPADASFSKKGLESAVKDWVLQLTPEDGELFVTRFQAPNVTRLPKGPIEYRIQSRGGNSLVGRRSLLVDLLIRGDVVKTIAVQVEVTLETMVPVVIQDTQRGTPLSDANITWEMRRLTRIGAPLVTPDQFDGLSARSNLRAGDILDTRKVMVTPLVERNRPVLVVAKRGGLSVSMKALALDKGAAGDRIRIKNLESGQVFTGIVRKNGQVQLEML